MESHNYRKSLKSDLNLNYIIPKCNNFFKRKISPDELKNKPELLDAGTGSGQHYKYLNKLFQVTGVDKSQNMLDLARTRNPLGNFVADDLNNSDLFTKNKFIGITCFVDSLYQNSEEKMDTILRNFHNWLKKDGLLFLHIFDPK